MDERTEAVRVLVRAAFPAVRAGLAALLTQRGFAVLDESDTSPPGPDVIVSDGPVEARLPLVIVSDAAPLAPSNVGPAAGPTAWLPADADAGVIAAAVTAVAAGLSVVHPEARAQIVARGGTDEDAGGLLTSREAEVLRLVAAGLTNRAIAQRLGISEHTAKSHVGAAIGKLGAQSRTEAMTLAARQGLLTL